jgi:hypothetical protein
MRTKIAVGWGIFLGCALPAAADLVFQNGSLFLGPIALVSEAWLVAHLLARRGFDYSRTFWTWLLVNLVTCGFMNLALFTLGVDVYHGRILWFLTPILIFEAAVVLAEAAIIMWMSRRERYRNAGSPFRWKSALIVSLIGNLASFGISFLALFIPAGGGPVPPGGFQPPS